MVRAERHHGADLAKWIGLVLMVLDHAFNAIPAEWQSIYGYVRVPGRLAFPIFCAVIAINVMRSPPGDLGSFKRNLVGLLWFEALSVATLALSWGEPRLTVLTTLAGGLVIAAAMHHGTLMLRVAACTILFAGFAANLQSNVFDYGFWGLLMPAAFMAVFRARDQGNSEAWMAWIAGLMMLLPLANYGFTQIMIALASGLPDGYKAWVFAATFIAPIVTLYLVSIELTRIAPVGKWAYVVHPAHYQALGFMRPLLGS